MCYLQFTAFLFLFFYLLTRRFSRRIPLFPIQVEVQARDSLNLKWVYGVSLTYQILVKTSQYYHKIKIFIWHPNLSYLARTYNSSFALWSPPLSMNPSLVQGSIAALMLLVKMDYSVVVCAKASDDSCGRDMIWW